VTAPAHGSAAIVDAHHVQYTPAADFHGADAFSYTIEDSSGAPGTAAVLITVTSVNDAPLANADAASVDEDGSASMDVVANDFDLDGDVLTITAITQPAHGLAAIADGHHVTYTPAPDYHGPDALSYTISDGQGGEATASVTLQVTSVDDAPIAVGDAASVAEDASAVIDVAANDGDVDGDALTVVAVTAPAHGSATIVDAHQVQYTPAADFHGADAFSYTIEDASGAQGTATVLITVTSVNDAPIANADTASVDEDGSASVDVVANDFDLDGDVLTITAITQPAHGLAAIADGQHVSYTPAPDYHGADALSYTISDGAGGTASATLELAVASVNDVPVAVDDAASLDEDAEVELAVVENDTDADGDALTITEVTQPAHGAALISDGAHVRYVPAANYHGADSFAYTISDGAGGTATATVTLEVASVNDAPVAQGDAQGLDEDIVTVLDLVANDSDVDGDPLTIASVTQPAHGSAVISDGQHVTYTPATDYHGGDSFSYEIGDGAGGSATATVALTVASINDAPVAVSLAISTFDDTPVGASLAASDVDGDALSFAIVTAPTNGTLGALAGTQVSYTPALGFVGSDSFTYVASDGTLSSLATVSITVIQSVCGNGVAEGVHEECDDGNAAPADGCESTCRLTCGSGTGAERATVDAASGHCFAAYDGVVHSYQQAAALCASLGGHLPTIGSASEDAAAFAAVQPGDHPWLGADDLAVEGTFRWTTGEPFGYTGFAAGQPDDDGGADCAQYQGDGTWADASCATTTGALCEVELVTATPAFATGGTGTRGVTVADLNGDGFLDVAATHPASNTVGVLLGNGTGGFAPRATFAAGTNPIAITSGDFDGDGDGDLAIVNATANTATILLGAGDGTFTPGATVAIAAGATSIAAADLNQDGVLDLAIGATNTVQTLRGNGSGGFTAGGSISLLLLGLPASIAVGDFDHDGRADLAVSTSLAVLVIKGTGGGGFGLPLSLAVTLNNRAIAAADLDGDGELDLAIANGAASVTVFFGTALGVFGSATTLSVTGVPQQVVTGDFDGDGGKDVVALSDGYATLFHGAGRTFTSAGARIATGGAGALVAGNLNGDGAADLVVANAATSTVSVVLGGPAGLAGARALVAGTASNATVTADFNEDGRPDLAVIDPGSNKVFAFTQTAGGALVAGGTVTLPANGAASFGAVADFNGDGHVDIAVVNVGFSSVSVLLGAGNGTFGAPLNTATAQGPRRLAVGDFNGDGRPDLAVGAVTANVVSILVNTGNGRFGKIDVAASGAPAGVAVGDFNGDGKADVAVATTGDASVKVLLGNGNATFLAAAVFATAGAGQAITAADVNGDGILDLISTNTAAGSVSVLAGTGTGSFGAATAVATGAAPSSVTAIDLDGDGRRDLAVGTASGVTVLHGDPAGGFVAFQVALAAAATWVTAVDLDGDGHRDLVASTAGAFATMLLSPR